MDNHLLFLINHKWTNPLLDFLLGTLSCTDFWVPIFGLGGAALVWKYKLRGLACIAFCVLSVLGNEQLISQPLKQWTARARPHQALEGIRRVDMAPSKPRILAVFAPMRISFSPPPNLDDKIKRSFPSSHTLNATTLGLIFALFFRMRLWLLLPLLMAWSRVYTGAHWPSDVAASMLMGVLFNGLLIAGAEWLWRTRVLKMRPDWVPLYPMFLLPYPQKGPLPDLAKP